MLINVIVFLLYTVTFVMIYKKNMITRSDLTRYKLNETTFEIK